MGQIPRSIERIFSCIYFQ